MEEDQKQHTKRSNWDIRPYLAIGALIFLVFCCCIIVFAVIFKYAALKSAVSVLVSVLQPITIGLILGYLLNPILRRIDGLLCDAILPRVSNQEKTKRTIRTVASILTLLLFLALIGLIIYMMLPALIESVMNLVNGMSSNVDQFINWYNNFEFHGRHTQELEAYLIQATQYAENWLKTSVLPEMNNYLQSITMGALNVVVVLKNVIIGLIVAVYVLIEKEHFGGQAKAIAYAVLPTKQANSLVATIHKVDQIFGGFIIGKIIDSFIIGVICFVGCSILKMPYTLLVSVIVGVTNVIPFFGPFIGAVPSVIIVTITNPMHGLYLLIFILILQQVDGNIIGPKILGDSTGLSSFWVIFAIMVGGGLFGFMGMLFGVPAFAVIYYLLKQLITYLLHRRELPTDSLDYTQVTHIDLQTKKLCSDGWERAKSSFTLSGKHKAEKDAKKQAADETDKTEV